MSGTEIRKRLLKEVEACVCKDRQNTYGDAEDNFKDIADLANVMFNDKLLKKLDAKDVAIFSMCIKMARIKTSPFHIDNWIDQAGYAICGGGIVQGPKEPT